MKTLTVLFLSLALLLSFTGDKEKVIEINEHPKKEIALEKKQLPKK